MINQSFERYAEDLLEICYADLGIPSPLLLGWEPPRDRFIDYEPTDYHWLRKLGFGSDMTNYSSARGNLSVWNKIYG